MNKMKMQLLNLAIILGLIFLVGCEDKNDTNPKQEYLFGIRHINSDFNLSYLNLNTLEITNYKLPINSGLLFRGVFDGIRSYYVSANDSIFKVDIEKKTIESRFKGNDSIIYLYNAKDNNEIIGLCVINDTVKIFNLSLTTGHSRLIKTNLLSNSAGFISNAAYNSKDKNILIKIKNRAYVVDINNGIDLYDFEFPDIFHGLRYLEGDNQLAGIEFNNGNLYFKKYTTNGVELSSTLINIDIVGFLADNFVVDDEGNYIFIGLNNSQNANIVKISNDQISQKELLLYYGNPIFDLTYIKK